VGIGVDVGSGVDVGIKVAVGCGVAGGRVGVADWQAVKIKAAIQAMVARFFFMDAPLLERGLEDI
jgi:hypothetical protein